MREKKMKFKSKNSFISIKTHTTAPGIFLYHIPRNLFIELPGEKKPSSKLWDEETNVSPSLMAAANDNFMIDKNIKR